jgi:hypothetical protein
VDEDVPYRTVLDVHPVIIRQSTPELQHAHQLDVE